MDISQLIIPVLVAVFAIVGTFLLVRLFDQLHRTMATEQSREMVRQAKIEAENITREAELAAKEQSILLKEKNEAEFRKIHDELHEKERQLDKRQDTLDKQADDLRKQERLVENYQTKLTEKIAEADQKNTDLLKLIEKERRTLHEFAGLNREEAAEKLFAMLDQELQKEIGGTIARHEKQIKERCDMISRNMLLLALQRYAASHTAETTTSSIDIPNDEMKGRLIGREGRNIRTFEKATGTDLLIDDTPGVVIISCFDPIRREAARLALVRLIQDGRIHPARIEEIAAETQKDVNAFIQKTGERAVQEVGLFGLNDRIIELLGRLHFRTSYCQNILRHSIEVAFIAGALAAELGLNEKLAQRCGLLHDIGKATDHEAEGTHPKIGADLLKRYGEPAEVVQAAAGHHDDARLENPYTMLVMTADACSAARPGARRESLELYVKRMEEIESIAGQFPGVEQVYAIQAGREIRVMLVAEQTTDETAAKICRDIAKTLTERVQFPGEIKVTVIRESRFVATAK
ncbi:MAG: ribonuclease Y [Planctomycetaceae bacterium]|jgi:ribonuclease Y|nr:ribonuclease Y [Planctomycetaceae bacterium]